jgi:hypothetical protein
MYNIDTNDLSPEQIEAILIASLLYGHITPCIICGKKFNHNSFNIPITGGKVYFWFNDESGSSHAKLVEDLLKR